ncbi:Guanosine-5'-triphosphate,3'-diphosphate pyrophosphatase [Rhodobacteraceae bacterium THAF1]|uniref:Ppx/GppA family phosphatase n=1 Tax=Palleronia sp. THAF1 TaxID=2587842 RepID=UPI000F416614|nr:Ppx/GppA family phosphatase [Palleronia sp. THAF1]QFU09340.1 Guanosine-5'-triphosphate,3'-diphosphate pyrophosphatase [Palleronia sp. THAF1]VDC26793.1 Guanosine-5'-triphosphate,3'-diphosphate pyrophosphatase [Rhodobacteraceae bacterium THAF1]
MPDTSHTDEYGAFGAPIFDDPSARALSRVAVIDIGSNSVRLVIFDGAARSPAYFFNEKVMAGLGAGFAQTGRLNAEGKKRAMSAMLRFARLIEGMNASPVIAIATAAMREAEDGPSFREEIEALTGITINIIDGEEEARLSAQGVFVGWPDAKGLVCDIGGSSMELAEVGDGRVGQRMTTPLGPLRLQGVTGGKKALQAHISDHVAALGKRFGPDHDRLFLVGGSWRAIARIDMERRGYPLHVLHEYRMSPKQVRETVKYIHDRSVDELRDSTGIGESRMSLVHLASTVLKTLVKQLKPKEIAISSYGIREGVLYEQMPDTLRERDPLIEACRFIEAKDARQPGFGRALYHFILPLFKSWPANRLRIVRAACLLHDVNWRAHPDYRHEACFDSATRANLGGMTHQERLFLGLSLLHRYKGGREGTRFEELIGVLTDRETKEAEILGRAMRFGAMFSAQEPLSHGELRWFPKRLHLELRIKDAAQDLFGEVAQSRFNALVSSLGATSEIARSRKP